MSVTTAYQGSTLQNVDTVPLSVFAPLVKVYCPDAPDPIIADMVRLSVTDLCERTRCWRHIVTVDLTDNNQAVVAPEYSAIHLFETASLNGVPLEPTQYSHIEANNVGAARYITQVNPNTVAVIPFEAGTLELTLFLKPRHGEDYSSDTGRPENAFNIAPRYLYETMAEPIAHGALARILEMPGHGYTNPQAAQQYWMRFNAFCDRQFRHSIRGQQRAVKRARYKDF